MTTELIELKTPIRIDVVQKQYKNGMQLDELARLYDVDEETLRPLVADIVPKERKVCNKEFHYSRLTKAELIEALEKKPTAFAFKRFAGIGSDKAMWDLLESHGLSHMMKTNEELAVEKYDRVIKALDSGMSRNEVRKEFKTSLELIHKAIDHFGREDLKRNAATSQEEYERLAEQVKQMVDTMTNKEIKAALDITQNQLNKVRKDYSIKPAKRERSKRFNPSIRPHKPKPAQPKGEPNVTNAKTEPMDFQELSDRIKRLFEIGMTTAEVIEETGISRATYYRVKEAHGKEWTVVDGRKERHKQPTAKKTKKPKRPKAQKVPNLIYPLEAKEEPTMPDVTTASLESAVTAFKEEEKPDLIGMLHDKMEHIARAERIEKRVLNRDKAVWGDYLSARSEEIEDVTHNVEVLVENGKLIERTTIAYTLERELGR